jgi:hypothetical protein
MYGHLSVYDPVAALAAIDSHKSVVLICLALAGGFSFVYFIIGVRMAIRQQVYVVPFISVALFIWHDGSYVLHYPLWVSVYHRHWWLMQWTYGLVGTVALEALLIYQFCRYGRKELMPETSVPAFAGLAILGTLGVGAIWYLVKAALADELYLVTQAITAVFPAIPFHTGIMLRRKSRAGQSIAMQLSIMLVFAAMSVVVMLASPFFFSPAYLTFFVVFMIWPAVNIWLILRYPPLKAANRTENGSTPDGAALYTGTG